MPISVNSALSDQDEMESRLALLIYSGREGVLSTIHKMSPGPLNGPRVIMPGECMSPGQLQQLTQKLTQRSATRQIIPAEVLVADQDLLVWHRPAHRRVMFFDTRDGDFNDEVNGRMALHPALLFLARPGSLQVFALATNERPDAKTPLYRAPYYNLYALGQMCAGNVKMPDNSAPTPEVIAGYEKAFFYSSFAHTGMGDSEVTSYRMGHNALWKMLVAADHAFFPNWTLIRAKMGPVEMTLRMALEARKK